MKYSLHRLSASLLYLFFASVLALLIYIVLSVQTAPVGSFAEALRVGMLMLREAAVSLMLAAAGCFSLELVIRSREKNQ